MIGTRGVSDPYHLITKRNALITNAKGASPIYYRDGITSLLCLFPFDLLNVQNHPVGSERCRKKNNKRI